MYKRVKFSILKKMYCEGYEWDKLQQDKNLIQNARTIILQKLHIDL